MQATTENYSPNGTYFRTGDVEPDITGDLLTIYSGKGQCRSSWGAPGVTSSVVVNGQDFIAIHIGWHHKHGGGQAWRYYVGADRRTWRQLSTDQQQAVASGYKAGKAPGWAKAPSITVA